jgi:hemerythrin-like metal-binding protein
VVRSLQWTEEHSVYLPELDEEHQAMFRLLEELRHAFVEGEAAANLESKLDYLAAEVTEHFLHEERLMRDARYPQIEWHKRQHATLHAQMASLANSIRAGERASTFESLEAIAKWARDHTTVADRMAGAYLRNHLRERANR